MNPSNPERSKMKKWLEMAGGAVAVLGAVAATSIWLFQSISDAAVKRALMPMRIERLETSGKEHEQRISDLEKKADVSITDRAALHREVAESRAALAGSIKDLAESLNRRLDRLDDKTEKISERVGVGR